jgi:hypothetical protein
VTLVNGTASDGPARALPGPGQRLRCSACGNLTRFDVVSRRRTSAYWHYSLAGHLTVESEQELESAAELVRCRWCRSENVEVVNAPGGGATHPPARVEPGGEQRA